VFYPHNQDARQPANPNEFPPPALVDMWYGCAALLQWGNRPTIDAIWSSVRSEYYNDVSSEGEGSPTEDNGNDSNGSNDLHGGGNSNGDVTPSEAEPAARSRRPREKGAHTQTGSYLNTMEEALDLVMLLRSYRKSGRREEPSPTQEQDQSREKVTAWLGS
jgi:hypothetical protein